MERENLAVDVKGNDIAPGKAWERRMRKLKPFIGVQRVRLPPGKG
jgi:hypothetical protein